MSDGLENVELSEKDIKAIENGKIPTCFLNDEINGNSTFNTLLAEQLFEKMKSLDYL